MVADLTRLTACTVHPDAPDQPVPERKDEQPQSDKVDIPDPTGDEPIRLFVWASA